MLNTIVIYNTVIHKNNVIIIILYQLKNKFNFKEVSVSALKSLIQIK